MRLARLELFGFKSFPDRTTFHFGPGISCVVGPNGSGKSNVVDALKWCVGEQSARSLRGSEMTDVIFAGSSDRKPVGFAEVMLTLVTDEAQPFPGDYSALREVQVGRRLHRSGTSEYVINQAKVRRRDVIELLLDSGIGNDLYSFIEQGQVDKMVSASPEERRSLIDEAAGISRYKARRDEARERLEATAAQLDRAADVVDEMARHLGALEGQVLKAAEFRRYGALVRLGELRLALAKHLALAEERVELRHELDELRADEAKVTAEVAARDADLVQRREELALVEAGIGTLRDQLAEVDAGVREANATAQLHDRREKELRTEGARATAEAEKHDARRIKELASAESADQEAASLVARADELGVAARTAGEQVDGAQAAVRAARAAVEVAEGEAQRATSAKMAADRASASAERERGDRELRIAALDADVAEAGVERVRKLHAKGEAEKGVAAAEEVLATAVAGVGVADAAWQGARGAEAEARARLAAAEEAREAELARERERQRAFRAMLDRGRQWMTGAERAYAAELRTAERSWSERLTAAEKAAVAGRNEARLRAEREGTERIAVAEREGAEAVAVAERGLAEAARVVASAKAAHDAAENEHLKASRARSAVDADLAVARRQFAASSKAGDRVRAVLPDGRTLAELAPDGEREAWVRKVGDRAGWRVVRDRDVLERIARERPEDATVELVWWPPDGPSPPDASRWVDGLADAWAGLLPAVGEGFRVDPGGFVTLGPPGALARAAANEVALVARLAELEVAVAAADRARGEKASALAEAKEGERAAGARRDELRKSLLAAVDAARSARSEGVAAAEAEARAQGEAAVAAVGLERDRTLAAKREGIASELERLRGVLQAAEAEGDTAPPTSTSADAVAPARADLASATERTETARERRDAANAARHAAERARDAAVAKVAAIAGEVERIDARIATCRAQSAELAAKREDPAKLLALAEAARAAGESEAAARADVLRLRAQVAELEGLERRVREDAGRLAVERTAATERAAGARDKASSGRARAEEAANAASSSRTHAAELIRQAEDAARAQAGAREEAANGQQERSELWDRLENERTRLHDLTAAADAADEALRALRVRLTEIGRELERLQSRQSGLSSDVEVLRSRIDDRYQVSLADALERLRSNGRLLLDVDVDVRRGLTIGGKVVEGVEPVELTLDGLRDERAVRAAVSHLDGHRQALARLGEVNLAAPAEYRDLSARHDELAAQRADLEASVEGIRTAIAKLNKMCRERFRETFDRVNGYFVDVYPRLVGGGSARLSLTDEEDLLETGVEIFVQPPGKRLQNLQLLSGGEKAMTAIALLIALFRVKPSPFCVLDEVDAPLDEANGARFNEMLKEMASRSQFLVITHNRKTMECADTLYGITMARPGVSRLVSVDLGAW